MAVLLSTAYCPPVEYFAAIASDFDYRRQRPAKVLIEACEHYQKQSWRNRCRILAADGSLDLNCPVRHRGNVYDTPVSEIFTDWSTDWLTRHKRAIVSAYGTSPYFEYYQDDFFAVLDKRCDRLLDYNTEILRFFLKKLHIDADLEFTSEFVPPAGEAVTLPASEERTADLRYVIHPKKENGIMSSLGLDRLYSQVFADRLGFVPHLSAMDLLFNEGPDSIMYLRREEAD